MESRRDARGQTSMISIVIIAGIVIAMIGVAYAWAMPMVEKRITITDFNSIESFMLDVNDRIVDIANTGSGETVIPIPKGSLEARGYRYNGTLNNSLILDFEVSQPIMLEGEVPLKTSSLDDVGDYGKTEPRVLMAYAASEGRNTRIEMAMRYRELRSATPKGYIIALCPSGGASDCRGTASGGSEVVVRYDRTDTVHRDALDGGDLTVTYITIEVR